MNESHPNPQAAHDADSRVYRINSLVHKLLLIGLTASALLMVTGTILEMARQDSLPQAMVPLDQLFAELARLNPAALLTAGLLLLIATPVARVLASIIGFLLERDWRYALVTFVVLMIVVLGILFGKG